MTQEDVDYYRREAQNEPNDRLVTLERQMKWILKKVDAIDKQIDQLSLYKEDRK